MGRLGPGMAVLALYACINGSAHADVTTRDEYTQRLKISQTIDPHGPTPFGEQLNPYTGDLTFSQADVVLEGTGPAIRLVRNHVSGQVGEGIQQPYSMGDWTLSIPRIETLTDADWHVSTAMDPGRNWFVATGNSADKYRRCTFFDRPAYQGTLDDPDRGWNGMTLVTEDGDQQPVLKRNASLNPLHPGIAEATIFPAVTQQYWQVGCLPQTSNGEEGEAFLVVSPDGVKYWLDHLSGVRAETISEADASGVGGWLRQGRMLAWMYATRVEDRFGNWVRYHYDGDELDYIDASDGRHVEITWAHVDGAALVSDIEVQPGATPARKWHYSYVTSTSSSGIVSAVLSDVTLPDQNHWVFQLARNIGVPISDTMLDHCGVVRDEGDLGSSTPTSSISTITHPSGLVGTFTVRSTWHGRSYVAGGCTDDLNHVSREDIPPLFGTMSLVSKRFSGPGLASQTWTYAYSPATGSTTQDPCALQGTCKDSSWVDVVDPAGNRTRHTYDTRWGATEGKEIQTDYYQGAALLRGVMMVYASPGQGPYPSNLGSSMMDPRTNKAKQETLTPVEDVRIAQQGEAFARTTTAFDRFARPVTLERDSSVSTMRSETTAYHDDPLDWVLGQVASMTVNGIENARTDYDARDLPWKTWTFGKLQQTSTYRANGELETVADGRGQATTLDGWERGIPTRIRYPATPEAPAGATISAEVDGFGDITAVTDETGATTRYEHDTMGRLKRITYPTDDQRTWHDTTMGFVRIGVAEYGIPAGHWRRTVATGYQRTITYYDALWRPVLTREYDTSDVADTDRYLATSYAPGGQADYTAYATNTAPTMDSGFWVSSTSAGLLPSEPDYPHDPDGGDTSGDTGGGTGGGTGGDTGGDTGSDTGGDPGGGAGGGTGGDAGGAAPTASTLPGVHTTYDALGRVTKVKQDSELGTLVTSTAYLDGFQTRTTNPRNIATTVTQYQAWDQPTTDSPLAITAAEGTMTRIARDLFGKPLWINRSAADGSVSQTRSYFYDANQRLCKVTEPETGATLMGYDAAGNLAWSASGQLASTPCDTDEVPPTALLAAAALHGYDARNRVTTLRFPDGLGDQDWTWTGDGLPATIVTWNGPAHTLPVINAYAYNRRRLLTGESSTHADGTTWSVGYGFDASAHLASQTYPDGRVVQYAPNALGQATGVTGGVWGVTYYPDGALKSFNYGNGEHHAMTQNLRGLPERSRDTYVASNGSTVAITDDAYDYDANGNVAAISDGATGRNQRGNRDMAYDGLDRLTDVASPMYGSTGAHYDYDALDNITRVVAPGRNHYYCYDGSNRLTNVKTGSCSGTSVNGLGYDPQGNLANKDGTRFAFDFGNRLRKVEYADSAVEAYQYDGHGRRVLATSNAGNIASFYSQSGQLLYQDNSRDGQTHSYLYLAGSLVNDFTHDKTTGANANRYQHTDALGSPVAVTNGPHTVLARSEFEPYGKLVNQAVIDGPGYAGHVSDAATGLSYMQQRYYDPGLGRFLSVDPISVNPNRGSGFNRYHYAANNPYRFIDPDGRQEKGSSSKACGDQPCPETPKPDEQPAPDAQSGPEPSPTPWIDSAKGQMGQQEIAGNDANENIISFLATTTYPSKSDETPWCSAFVNWSFVQANIVGTNSASALSWVSWGQELADPAVGSVAIINYGKGRGHVGFVLGVNKAGKIGLLGGNQSNSVRISYFSSSNIQNYVFPKTLVPNFTLPVLDGENAATYESTR